MKKGSQEHENEVQRFLDELKKDGYKVINLNGKSPDGIAVKNGKIFAVEVLKKIKTERKNYDSSMHHGRYIHRFSGGFTMAQKRSTYDMFDDVLFSTYW